MNQIGFQFFSEMSENLDICFEIMIGNKKKRKEK